MISIIITSFNKRPYLMRAIRSCLAQFCQTRFEVIIVDDCSTDGSRELLGALSDDRLKIIYNEKNVGVAASSNCGLQASQGDFFVRVDADDYISSGFLYIMFEFIRNFPDNDIYGCDILRVDDHERIIEFINRSEEPNRIAYGAGLIHRRGNYIDTSPYNEDNRTNEDADLMVRALKQGQRYYHVPLPLYRYYFVNGSLSTKQDWRKGLLNYQGILK